MNTQSTEDFGGYTILYDIVGVDRCQYTFFQTHIMYNTKSEASATYGCWAIEMYQHRFTNCNECTAQWEMLIMGETMGM